MVEWCSKIWRGGVYKTLLSRCFHQNHKWNELWKRRVAVFFYWRLLILLLLLDCFPWHDKFLRMFHFACYDDAQEIIANTRTHANTHTRKPLCLMFSNIIIKVQTHATASRINKYNGSCNHNLPRSPFLYLVSIVSDPVSLSVEKIIPIFI